MPAMSHASPSRSDLRSRSLAQAPAIAQRLPQDVLAQIASHLVYTASDPDKGDVEAFGLVCRAWRPAGLTAYWREVRFSPETARALQRHLENHPSYYGHIQSISLDMARAWDFGTDRARFAVSAIMASCPSLFRLEVTGECFAPPWGPLFRELEATVDLLKLTSVVIGWPYGPRTRYAYKSRYLSPVVLFDFLRKCKNLRHFTHAGWPECITTVSTMPPARRIKVNSLRIDIRNSAVDPTDDSVFDLRMRFLTQFHLAHIAKMRMRTYFGHKAWWTAVDLMVNLEVLELIDDFELQHGGLDELIRHLPGLSRLKTLEICGVDEDDPQAPSPASRAELQALLDAIPLSVETCNLWIPFPEEMAFKFFDSTLYRPLRIFRAYMYDPSRLRPVPTAQELSWGPAVQPPVVDDDDEWFSECEQHEWW